MFRKKIILSLILVISFTVCLEGKTRKTLYLIVDGVEPDFLEMVHPKTIFDIAKTGSYGHGYCGGQTGTYTESFTLSAIGYSNILFGTWMNKHRVTANENLNPNYNYWNLFRIAKNQKKDYKTAVFTSWTDNTTYLVGKDKEANGNLKVDFVADGFDLDNKQFPKKELDLQIYDIDSVVCQRAAECVRKNAPDLSWVYLWYTDDAFHYKGFGDFSKEYLLKEDRLIDLIWQAIKYREKNFDEEWLFIVTTDHGREAKGFDHGSQSASERSIWMAVNRKDLNAHFYSPSLSQVDILPSICRWMNFDVPQNVAWEQDGVSFIGEYDISNLRVFKYDNKAILKWDSTNNDETVSVYMASTNNFKDGGADNWVKIGEVPAKKGTYTAEFPDGNSFYKFEVVSPNTHLTKWLMLK